MIIKNIKSLIQTREESHTPLLKGAEMSQLPSIENAWLKTDGAIIHDFGKMATCPEAENGEEMIDASGKLVFPTWVDSHTHLVFAGSREEEFVMRLKGKSYQEIAAAGGGILNSAKKLQACDEATLFKAAQARLNEQVPLK